MSKINILGVNINIYNKKQVLTKIKEFLIDGQQHIIVTPNPEIILEANKDKEFFDILNKADLAVPDGVGLKLAGWLVGVNLSRITGADLLKDIFAMAEEESRRVAILNWQCGLSCESDIRQVLNDKYNALQTLIVDIDRGTIIPEEKLVRIKEFQPEIIFCTLGAPYQEKFIYNNLGKLPSVKIGMGIGGALDFLTGKLPRAPFCLRKTGLEWLWRLIKQPSRWRRIYNAVIVFPVKFIIWRFNLRK